MSKALNRNVFPFRALDKKSNIFVELFNGTRIVVWALQLNKLIEKGSKRARLAPYQLTSLLFADGPTSVAHSGLTAIAEGEQLDWLPAYTASGSARPFE